jgi:hypothetical protein
MIESTIEVFIKLSIFLQFFFYFLVILSHALGT